MKLLCKNQVEKIVAGFIKQHWVSVFMDLALSKISTLNSLRRQR